RPAGTASDRRRSGAGGAHCGAMCWRRAPRHSKPFLRQALPVYKQALSDAGREFRGIPLQRDLCVAKDARAARALVEKSYVRQLHMQSGWGQPGERYDVPFEQLIENRMVLGSPQEAAEELIAIHRE